MTKFIKRLFIFIGGIIVGTTMVFYIIIRSDDLRKALANIIATKIETFIYGEKYFNRENHINSKISYKSFYRN